MPSVEDSRNKLCREMLPRITAGTCSQLKAKDSSRLLALSPNSMEFALSISRQTLMRGSPYPPASGRSSTGVRQPQNEDAGLGLGSPEVRSAERRFAPISIA